MRHLNRIVPRLPVQGWKTYAIDASLPGAWRPATCAEVECGCYTHGWVTRVDETSTLGQMQAHYIRKESGRSFREERQPDGLTAFIFEAGQTCFRPHQVRTAMPELFLVRGGDWRVNTGLIRRHDRSEEWVEDFAEHQDKIARQVERG